MHSVFAAVSGASCIVLPLAVRSEDSSEGTLAVLFITRTAMLYKGEAQMQPKALVSVHVKELAPIVQAPLALKLKHAKTSSS